MDDINRTPTITFEMTCNGATWKSIIDNYELSLELNPFNFDRKWLFVEAVPDFNEVYEYAYEKLIRTNIIDRCINVSEYIPKTLAFFNLYPENMDEAYLYSISEFVSLYLCETEFLLHYAGDVYSYYPIRWVAPAIDILDYDNRIKAVCPSWVNNDKRMSYPEARSSFVWDDQFCKHCYLIKVEDFRTPDVFHEEVGTFEKRIEAWMGLNNFIRVAYKNTENKYNPYELKKCA